MDPNITAAEVQDRIKVRAYEMWEADGRPHGADHQHWLAAQREVLEEVDRLGVTGPSVAEAATTHSRVAGADAGERQDVLLDEAVEETFPASDPISPKQIT